MAEHPSLAAALAAFQAEMPTVSKSKRADVPTKTGGKYSYTYADLAGVTEAAMPVLSKHGLSFLAKPRAGSQGYELVGVLMHTSGERERGALPIRGNTPQEIGSSLTYMRRYLFGCLTGIVTEDDHDGATAQKARSRPQPQDAPPPPAPQDPPTRAMSRPKASEEGTGVTARQMGALHASFNDAGVTDRDARLAYCRQLIGRDIETSNDLTKDEASRVLNALKSDAEATP